MKAVYIGILTAGTTSRMRAERLRVVTPGWEWSWIDTDGPMRAGARVWRSVAFRWKRGPVVAVINREVRRQLSGEGHGLAWVDKGVFLDATTMCCLRARAKRLVHFTPDTAFFQNRSRWFEAAIRDYDLLVTTKSFEAGHYEARGAGERLLLTTQGYDGTLHRPPAPAVERRSSACAPCARDAQAQGSSSAGPDSCRQRACASRSAHLRQSVCPALPAAPGFDARGRF